MGERVGAQREWINLRMMVEAGRRRCGKVVEFTLRH